MPAGKHPAVERPLWARLEQLDQAVLAALERRERLETERSRVLRRVEEAFGPLRADHHALGAGERQPDAKLEAKLRADVQAAHEGIRLVPRRGRDGPLSGLDYVDDALEAQVAGAFEAATNAENERDGFLQANRQALLDELRPGAQQARDHLQAAYEDLRAGEQEWMTVLQLAARLVGLKRLPANPLHGMNITIDRDGFTLPLPEEPKPPQPHPPDGAEFRPATAAARYPGTGNPL